MNDSQTKTKDMKRFASHRLALAAALAAKYGPTYEPAPDTWDEGGLWRVRATVAFGWTTFPTNVTRWRFREP